MRHQVPFLSIFMTLRRIEPRSHVPLANILIIRPMEWRFFTLIAFWTTFKLSDFKQIKKIIEVFTFLTIRFYWYRFIRNKPSLVGETIYFIIYVFSFKKFLFSHPTRISILLSNAIFPVCLQLTNKDKPLLQNWLANDSFHYYGTWAGLKSSALQRLLAHFPVD